MKFKCGDVVELNSGGPPMVVQGYKSEPGEGFYVLAEWEDDNGEKVGHWFCEECVHRIGKEQIAV